MSYSYNPWPLGALPIEMQRPEPQELRKQGYHWSDPRDIVDIFEEKLALYTNSRYAVVTDSCTSAIFLCLKIKQETGRISIPAKTYVSIPMAIYHAGGTPVLEDIEWSGLYQLGDTGIWDSAARFTKDMYLGHGALQCLSFQIKKRLPIGKGGAILTDDSVVYKELKLMSYDGRNLKSPYTHELHIERLGWHMYMTPEDAARGILLMDMIPEYNVDIMGSSHYPDLRLWPEVQRLTDGIDVK
jgi:dTDP-4-amino-4,6-dideoxygalactose transaminase